MRYSLVAVTCLILAFIDIGGCGTGSATPAPAAETSRPAADAKPADVKPADAKPVDAKPGNAQPGDPTPPAAPAK